MSDEVNVSILTRSEAPQMRCYKKKSAGLIMIEERVALLIEKKYQNVSKWLKDKNLYAQKGVNDLYQKG